MVTELVFTSLSTEATSHLGWLIGQVATPNLVLALDGELGTGKTALVRGLAVGLDVEDAVSSPTYTLMHSYRGRLELFHFDAWMEGREAAFLDGGGAEWFTSGGVAVVEWASRVIRHLPADRLELKLSHQGQLLFDEEGQLDPRQERGIKLHATGPATAALLSALAPKIRSDSGFRFPAEG